MRVGFTFAAKSWFQVYWKLVIALYAMEFTLLLLWNVGLLGESCRFNGSAMEQCFLLGVNIDYFADAFISVWMIPLIGIVFGLLRPLFAAITPSFFIWIVVFFFQLRKIQDLPEPEEKPTPSVEMNR
jgi:hypothetical protein